MVEQMRGLYDGLDLNRPDMPAAGAEQLGPPGGAYLVGYRTFFGEKRLPG